MDEADRRLRNTTYAMFVELGRAPDVDEVALAERLDVTDVQAAWWRLHDARGLVLHPNGSIRMANPFAAAPTAHRVRASGRWWFANCAWDAIGICAALHVDGDVESSCPCCADPIRVSVTAAAPSDESLLFHCLVPAAAWWDDIGFT